MLQSEQGSNWHSVGRKKSSSAFSLVTPFLSHSNRPPFLSFTNPVLRRAKWFNDFGQHITVGIFSWFIPYFGFANDASCPVFMQNYLLSLSIYEMVYCHCVYECHCKFQEHIDLVFTDNDAEWFQWQKDLRKLLVKSNCLHCCMVFQLFPPWICWFYLQVCVCVCFSIFHTNFFGGFTTCTRNRNWIAKLLIGSLVLHRYCWWLLQIRRMWLNRFWLALYLCRKEIRKLTESWVEPPEKSRKKKKLSTRN